MPGASGGGFFGGNAPKNPIVRYIVNGIGGLFGNSAKSNVQSFLSNSDPADLVSATQDLTGTVDDWTQQLQSIQDSNNTFAAEQAAIDRYFQQASAREAMEFESAQANLNRNFQQASAREAMEFERQMSNTSYQRAIADLQAAGLNPALAYQQGGASSPSGVSASGTTVSGRQASGSATQVDNNTVASLLGSFVSSAASLRASLTSAQIRSVTDIVGAVIKRA